MNTKRKLLSLVLALATVISSIHLPQTEFVVLAADGLMTLTVQNEKFYNYLVKDAITFVSNNDGALVAHDDEEQTITLNMEKVKYLQIRGIDMDEDNSMEIFKTLVCGCTNLESLRVRKCNLSGFDFSVLNGNENIKYMYLVDSIDKVPDVTLPNLRTLCLSKNNLSAGEACDFLTENNFPKLNCLWLDDCMISNLDFLGNLGEGLTELSLAADRLTDDSMAALLEAGRTNLSNLTKLSMGRDVHTWGSVEYNKYVDSSNKITDYKNLALLPECFPKLTTLDLRCLKITSIREFADVRDDITIKFQGNKICDFTGFRGNSNFELREQKISVSSNYAAGREGEIPEWIEMILNHDLLKGELEYNGCGLSDDGTKLVILPDVKNASIKVKSGRLSGTEVTVGLKEIPKYTIPQDLTAIVGSILADIVLPEGFAWKDATSDVGQEGTNIFQAVYTPKNTDRYIIDTVNIPVTVKKKVTDVTPDNPNPAPDNPTPDNPDPTPTPDNPDPTPTPDNPTPDDPEPTPDDPEPTPDNPKPDVTPDDSQKEPDNPTPAPGISTPTSKPDESGLTGNQIADRKDLSILLAIGKQNGSDGIKLTWRKKNDCSGYEVYWSYCNGKKNYKRLKTVKGSGKCECVHKKLKKNRAYKYYVVSYTIKDGKKSYQSKSPVIHVAMKNGKRTNAKKIKVNKAKLVLSVNQTFQIKAKAVLENQKKKLLCHEKKFRYYVDNPDVVSISKGGKIKAKKKGSCIVYVTANNGVAKKVKVTVK